MVVVVVMVVRTPMKLLHLNCTPLHRTSKKKNQRCFAVGKVGAHYVSKLSRNNHCKTFTGLPLTHQRFSSPFFDCCAPRGFFLCSFQQPQLSFKL